MVPMQILNTLGMESFLYQESSDQKSIPEALSEIAKDPRKLYGCCRRIKQLCRERHF